MNARPDAGYTNAVYRRSDELTETSPVVSSRFGFRERVAAVPY